MLKYQDRCYKNNKTRREKNYKTMDTKIELLNPVSCHSQEQKNKIVSI